MFTRPTTIRTALSTALAVAALGLTGTAHAEDVLVLHGGKVAWGNKVVDRLEGFGHDAELGPAFHELTDDEDLDDYDVVVILASHDYSTEFPSSAQQQILEFLEAGGGIVTAEWLAYNLRNSNGPLVNAMPVTYDSYDSEETATYRRATQDPVMTAGLPQSFTFDADDYGGSEAALSATSESTVFFTSDLGDAVVGRDYGHGRIVSISTLMGPDALQHPKYRRLVSNAVMWSAHGLSGSTPDDRFGHAVANVGDITNSGTAEFAISAPWDDTNGANAGAFRIFNGAAYSNNLWVHGQNPGDRLGWAMSPFHGSRFAVSAPWNDDAGSNAGAVHIYNTSLDVERTFYGEHAGDRFGQSIDGGHDVDGDGTNDLIVGAPKFDAPNRPNCGKVYVFSGSTGALIYSHVGAKKNDLCGWSVAMIGDTNNDGRSEYLAGEPKNDMDGSNAGRITVFRNGSVHKRVTGKRNGDQYGRKVAGVGDVNGDGRPDYAVGSPFSDTASLKDAGRIDVYSGKNGKRLWYQRGFTAKGRYGHSIDHAGDVDGDGLADVIAGMPRYGKTMNGSWQANIGRVHVRSGRDGSSIARLTGEETDAHFGYSVAGALDPDQSGFEDVLIGAPEAGADDHGNAFLVYFDQDGADFDRVAGPTMHVDVDDACSADWNADGHVDMNDLVAVMTTTDTDADLDANGTIDAIDFIEVLVQFGGCR